ncbi:glycosyltransferase family 2 protein [Aureimonas sp. AU40]|uniref:glycosyltransferase family 2 protein n=1 Tax=Aureimonas sp. AU40 TaxID=1637747 RepID=UPI0012E3343D|nr:glycosyltransferase family 2 protein [Aureimonas sp. AU40]
MSQEPRLPVPNELSGPDLMAGTQAHEEALVLAATRALGSGRPRDVFALADRRCRLSAPPPASALALRALALWFLNAREDAAVDLARAFAADPADPLVALAMLQLSKAGADLPDPSALVAQTAMPHELLRLALGRLFAGGVPAVARLDLFDGRLLGWIAWNGEAEQLDLHLKGEEGEARSPIRADAAFTLAPRGARGAFVDLPASPTARGFALHSSDLPEPMASGQLWPRTSVALSDPARRAPHLIPARRPVVVLIPVYEDFEATQEGLRAAVAAKGPGVRVLVVDDASPNRKLALLLDALAGRGLVELLRNPHNLGFAGAVNRGLASLPGGEDVLILNSDAALPPGAVERLADVAYGEAGIGTVTSLSNAGEFASFPVRSDKTAMPSPEDARRLDALAASLHGARAVDLPTGTGFCLFVRHDALAAVRGFSTLFGRGYFEDLDLSLRVRAAGFRNVAAPGIFVAHHGGRSFSTERGALLARNRRLADRRFPAHRPEARAFAAADPLRAARAGLEVALGGSTGARLVVFARGDVAAREHLFCLRRDGDEALALSWHRAEGRTLLSLRAGEPHAAAQSLELPPDDEQAWHDLFTRLAPGVVDMVGPPPPAILRNVLTDLGAPMDALFEGPDAVAALEAWGGASAHPFRGLHVADEGTGALLLRDLGLEAERLDHIAFAESSSENEAAPAPPLGLPMPAPGPRAEAFVHAVSAALRARAPDQMLFVLGRALDEAALFSLGNVFVIGPTEPGDLAWLARRLALGALALPPGLGGWGQLARLGAETGLPLALVDPAGRRAASPPNLYLDPSARDRDNAHALVDWLLGGIPPAPA